MRVQRSLCFPQKFCDRFTVLLMCTKRMFFNVPSKTDNFVRRVFGKRPGVLPAEVRRFLEGTSVKGVPRIFKAEGAWSRVLWTGSVLLLIACCALQSYVALTSYFSHPTVSVLSNERIEPDPARENHTPLPSVSVCNLNSYGSRLRDAATLALLARYEDAFDALVRGWNSTLGPDRFDADATSPRGPDATSPWGPDATSPWGPDVTSPWGPDATSPWGPDATSPWGPDATPPWGPDATSPWGPDATSPGGPDATSPSDELDKDGFRNAFLSEKYTPSSLYQFASEDERRLLDPDHLALDCHVAAYQGNLVELTPCAAAGPGRQSVRVSGVSTTDLFGCLTFTPPPPGRALPPPGAAGLVLTLYLRNLPPRRAEPLPYAPRYHGIARAGAAGLRFLV